MSECFPLLFERCGVAKENVGLEVLSDEIRVCAEGSQKAVAYVTLNALNHPFWAYLS